MNMKIAAFYETAFGFQFPGASSIKNSSEYTIVNESPDVKSENEKNQEILCSFRQFLRNMVYIQIMISDRD